MSALTPLGRTVVAVALLASVGTGAAIVVSMTEGKYQAAQAELVKCQDWYAHLVKTNETLRSQLRQRARR